MNLNGSAGLPNFRYKLQLRPPFNSRPGSPYAAPPQTVQCTGRDSATFRDKGTEVPSLSRDKGTTGQAQNLATGRNGIFYRLSRPVPGRPGTQSLSILFIKCTIFSYDFLFQNIFSCFRTYLLLFQNVLSCFRTSFFSFRTSFSCFRTSFLVLELPILIQKHPKMMEKC